MSVIHKALACLSVISCLAAIPNQAHAEAMTDSEYCLSQYQFGHVVMTDRQNGVSLPDMMKRAEQVGLFPHDVATIRRAYTSNRFSTKDYQDREIQKFAEDVYNRCTKQYNI